MKSKTRPADVRHLSIRAADCFMVNWRGRFMRIRMPCAAFLHCCIFHSVQAARAALPQRRALSSASLLRRSASLSFISSHIRSWFTIPAIALSSSLYSSSVPSYGSVSLLYCFRFPMTFRPPGNYLVVGGVTKNTERIYFCRVNIRN